MKFANHFMIDIETLGNNPNAIILSFCITHFTNTGIKESLTCNISVDTCIRNGLQITASTLKWWATQDQKLFNEQLAGEIDLAVALHLLKNFVEKNYDHRCPNYFWSYGTLDFEVLENCCRVLYISAPWYYYEKMDLHTLSNYRAHIPFIQEGNLHNPETDCINQINHLLKIL